MMSGQRSVQSKSPSSVLQKFVDQYETPDHTPDDGERDRLQEFGRGLIEQLEAERLIVSDVDTASKIAADIEDKANGLRVEPEWIAEAVARETMKVLEWIEYHYANQDKNHEDFRVEVYILALGALAAARGTGAAGEESARS